VNECQGVIGPIQADFAERCDSVLLPSLVRPLHQRLFMQHLPLLGVAADSGYSNGVNYALLEAPGITPWFPVFGKYQPEATGFTCDAETDCFTCRAGKALYLSQSLPRVKTVG